MRWAGLLLLCSLTVCAAQPVTVTVQPNSCSIQSYQITNAPTTYSLNVTSLPSANSDCSNTNLLISQDLLTTGTCQTDTSNNSDFGSEDSTDSAYCQSGYNSTTSSCIQDFNYYTGSLTGSLGQLTSGMVFNNTFCYNAATFFFIYNECNHALTFTYEVLEDKDNSYTSAFCTVIDYNTVSHTTAIVVGSIIGVIVLIFVVAICCGAFVPCCAACAGLALLRSNRRQNQAPGPIPPAQFQPTYGGTGGAPNYQPFDQYQQYPPQPYPGVPPAGGNPAYGGQYSAGAAPIYGGYPPPQTGGYPQQPGGYPPQGRDYAPQTGGTAEMTDFTKPQYAPVNGVRPVQ